MKTSKMLVFLGLVGAVSFLSSVGYAKTFLLDEPQANQTSDPISSSPAVSPAQPDGDFDPQLHIDVDQLKPGMKGYGLTVFKGIVPERFELEIVSILHTFGVKRNAILIRCLDDRFTLAKVVGGVSGSPVFFNDKLAGAMAFGWSFSEEPIYGVTPIREMLDVSRSMLPRSDNKKPGPSAAALFDRSIYQDLMADELLSKEHIRLLVQASGLGGTNYLSDSNPALAGLIPIPMAVTLNGVSPLALEQFNQLVPGVQFNLAGSTNIQIALKLDQKPTLQRGASLTIPFFMGDMTGGPLGTVTEVMGDKVYAFGHYWNALGDSFFPMATGYVHTVLSSKFRSFKIGQPVEIVGAIRADEMAGIYGEIGTSIDLIPMDISIDWKHIKVSENFQIRVLQNEFMSPILCPIAAMSCMFYRGALPLEHTLNYQVHMEFDGFEPITYKNTSSGLSVNEVYFDMISALALVMDNPWNPISLKKVEFHASIDNQDKRFALYDAQLPKRIYYPGQTIRVHLTLEPLRAERVKRQVTLKLPEDLPPGPYKLQIGSASDYRRLLQSTQPHRFRVYDIDDLHRILQERLSIDRAGIYMTMALGPQGIAIDDQVLPHLPSSRALMLTDKSRAATTTPYRPILVTHTDDDFLLLGRHIFDIQVLPEQ